MVKLPMVMSWVVLNSMTSLNSFKSPLIDERWTFAFWSSWKNSVLDGIAGVLVRGYWLKALIRCEIIRGSEGLIVVGDLLDLP